MEKHECPACGWSGDHSKPCPIARLERELSATETQADALSAELQRVTRELAEARAQVEHGKVVQACHAPRIQERDAALDRAAKAEDRWTTALAVQKHLEKEVIRLDQERDQAIRERDEARGLVDWLWGYTRQVPPDIEQATEAALKRWGMR